MMLRFELDCELEGNAQVYSMYYFHDKLLYTYIHKCIYMQTHTHTHTHIYIYMCVCVCVCVCIYMHLCIYVSKCIINMYAQLYAYEKLFRVENFGELLLKTLREKS